MLVPNSKEGGIHMSKLAFFGLLFFLAALLMAPTACAIVPQATPTPTPKPTPVLVAQNQNLVNGIITVSSGGWYDSAF